MKMAAMFTASQMREGIERADCPLLEIPGDNAGELAAAFIPINCKHRFRNVAVVQKIGSKSPECSAIAPVAAH